MSPIERAGGVLALIPPEERAYLIKCAEASASECAQAITSLTQCISRGQDLRGASLAPDEIKEAEREREKERLRARAHLSLVQAIQSIR